jgi:hypothetical protein
MKPFAHFSEATIEPRRAYRDPGMGTDVFRNKPAVTAENRVRMKLNILSDLHLSLGALEIPQIDADLVILAETSPARRRLFAWALGFAKLVALCSRKSRASRGQHLRAPWMN